MSFTLTCGFSADAWHSNASKIKTTKLAQKRQNGNSVPSHPVMPTRTHCCFQHMLSGSRRVTNHRRTGSCVHSHSQLADIPDWESIFRHLRGLRAEKRSHCWMHHTDKRLPTVSCSSLITNTWQADLCVRLYQLVHSDSAHKNILTYPDKT